MKAFKAVILKQFIPLNIIKLNAIDSTNTYLKDLAKDSLPKNGTIVVAKKQLLGRGQMNAGWYSREGQSLTFSMFNLFNKLDASVQFAISMAVSLGVKQALMQLNIPQVSIKWPNDILSAKKKVCGILIENVLERSLIRYSIIGVGINVNETEFLDLPQASSLLLEGGTPFNIDEVLAVVSKSISENLKNLENANFEELKNEYEKNLFRKDTVSVFESPEGIRFNAIIKGVTEMGELLAETDDAVLKKFQLKELKMIF